MKLRKRLLAVLAVATLTVTGFSTSIDTIQENITATAVDDCNDDWLHAEGSRLYDSEGNEVWLTGANWFGFNCSENCVHYLWSADIDDLLEEISDRGINIIRFPISSELLISWMNGTPNEVSSVSANNDEYYSINVDFCNEDGSIKNSMEIFDIIIQKCKTYGLKAFVDVHSPDANNSGHNYNLWYGKETTDGIMVTTELWMESLTWLAKKYANDDTILGYDLKNEPHGKGQEGDEAAKWDGSTDENNWAYAATQCANSILAVNPNALIFVEGVEQSLKSDDYYWGQPDSLTDSPYIGAWWGGNLCGVRDYPVVPDSGTSQIVYSPHDYGPSVYDQTWFDKDFTTETLLDDYWYDTWAYINAEDIAPLLIGEWGGYMDGAENEKWMELLRDYMIENHISHTFWCLNTNSGDTGGLWADFAYSPDIGTTVTWEEDKYALFEPSLWQTLETGLYIGLDHETSLGINGTGLSLNEFYASYAYTEGSNLDGGTILFSDGTTATTTTTSSDTTTTSTTTTTTATTTELTTETSDTTIDFGDYEFRDINRDDVVNLADLVLLMRYLIRDISGGDYDWENGDVDGNGTLNGFDLALYRQYLLQYTTET
ncbi:MAG: cellulase family glycosylhydrolase [Ruminococcus sp.]|nr:cellulase family glycosylhydrolase [Ruminococcus sp.]